MISFGAFKILISVSLTESLRELLDSAGAHARLASGLIIDTLPAMLDTMRTWLLTRALCFFPSTGYATKAHRQNKISLGREQTHAGPSSRLLPFLLESPSFDLPFLPCV